MKVAIGTAAFLCLWGASASAHDDPHHPGQFDCSAELNSGTIFPTIAVSASSTASGVVAPAMFPATDFELGCSTPTYVQVSGVYNSFTVTPNFNGPNVTFSAGDCAHTSLNYSVYNANSAGVYSKVGGGILFGELVNGSCQHTLTAFASEGTASVSIPSSARNPIIAVHSWTHNDTAIGHPGTLCSATSCYWNSILVLKGTPTSTSFSQWLLPPDGSPFEPVDQYGPSFASKKSNRIWAFTVPFDNGLWMRTWGGANQNDWLSWQNQGQGNRVASKASGCNWLASGGVEADRNVVVAYVGWDGKVRVGHSMGSNYNFTWNVMNDSTDNAPATPAVAITNNNVLHLIVKKNDGTVRYKRNTVTTNSYSFSNWTSTWQTISMPSSGSLAGHRIAGGVAAAATASNTITVASSEMDANFNGSNNCVMANIVNGGSTQWSIIASGGCRLSKFSTPAMTAIGTNGSGGARIVVSDQSTDFDASTTILRTATTTNGTSWSSFKVGKGLVPRSSSCVHPTTDPAITQYKATGEIAIGAGCDGQTQLRWVTMTP